MKIILASGSPRRHELIKKITPDFVIKPVEVDESQVEASDPLRLAIKTAILKAKTCGQLNPDDVILAADTVVALGPKTLGKPMSREEARQMLSFLSGKRHRVITGLAIYRHSDERLLTGAELTYVSFLELDEKTIEDYLDKNDFVDKAGAYAIQDVKEKFIKQVKGDYENVVGLPVRTVKKLLDLFAVPPAVVEVQVPAFPESGGLATIEGKELHVKKALPGDRVKIHITSQKKGKLSAEILKIISGSPFREKPACPHFGECGGCLFQDYAYEKQLELKEKYIHQIFNDSKLKHHISSKISQITGSVEKFGYRNKMEYAFGESQKNIFIGLRARNDLERFPYRWTVAIKQCPILGRRAEALIRELLQVFRKKQWSAFDQTSGRGHLRHLVIREGKKTGDLMILLVTTSNFQACLTNLVEIIENEFPEITSFYHIENDRRADVVAFEKINLISGQPYIEEKLEDFRYRIYPSTFFQTNTLAAELLLKRIRQEAQRISPENVLGLYCGVGTIEIFLSRMGFKLTGIDISPDNIRAAMENAWLNNASNCSFEVSQAEKIVDLANSKGQSGFDLLIVDPPRAGLSAKALRQLLALGAPNIMYVSCNVSSLVRDLEGLIDAGYSITTVQPFDFFPHTPHTEILTVLEK